ATVVVACGRERRHVLARAALREPGGDFSPQHSACDGVLALAVDDEHATLAAGALRAQELDQLVARLVGAQTVQVEPRVDRKKPTAKLAQQRWRHVDPPSFDALAVVA